jgi:sulfite reductase beta subunit-like hemoprotein
LFALAASVWRPASQNLPRKFKISFSGSPADRGLNLMHDVGAMAAVKNGARGFKVYVGGGLGPTPKAAHLLEDFTPAEELLKTIEACIVVFDRDWDYGRKFRNMARLEFGEPDLLDQELDARHVAVNSIITPPALPPDILLPAVGKVG